MASSRDTHHALVPQEARMQRQMELMTMGANATPASHFAQGSFSYPLLPGEDTLVFIKPAHLGATDPLDCAGNPIVPWIIAVPANKILATASPVFLKQFEPEFQKRLMRRHGVGYNMPRGIKWLMDLTPPEDGDEIGPQMVLLSLTAGLVKWAGAAAGLGVPSSLIMGHDDDCGCGLVNTSGDRKQASDAAALYNSWNTAWDSYSQTRHLQALARLMLVAKGHDLFIDSAPKMWTMVGLADILGCTSLIQDAVLLWLAEDRNRNFIVYLPEEALVIGNKMKLPDVVRSAFTVLVNELALDLLAKEKEEWKKVTRTNPSVLPDAGIPEYTVFGRKRNMDVLDDDLQSMLQEAAMQWADRVREAAGSVDPRNNNNSQSEKSNIFTIFNLPEWHNLQNDRILIEAAVDGVPGSHTQAEILKMQESIDKITKEAWASYIAEGLNMGGEPHVQSYGILGGKCLIWSDVTASFSTEQKLLCSSTWHGLQAYASANSTFGAKLRMIEVMEGSDPGLLMWQLCDEFETLMKFIDTNHKHFHLPMFNMQVNMAVRSMYSGWLSVENDLLLKGLDVGAIMVLNLEHNVYKMLPIYADGNDDETGGVYGMHIPDADMGPTGPGPAYRTGFTQFSAATSFAPSEATCPDTVTGTGTGTGTGMTAEGASTANASRDAARGGGTEVDGYGLRLKPGPVPKGIPVDESSSFSSMSRLGKGVRGMNMNKSEEYRARSLVDGDRSVVSTDDVAKMTAAAAAETKSGSYNSTSLRGTPGAPTRQTLLAPSETTGDSLAESDAVIVDIGNDEDIGFEIADESDREFDLDDEDEEGNDMGDIQEDSWYIISDI